MDLDKRATGFARARVGLASSGSPPISRMSAAFTGGD